MSPSIPAHVLMCDSANSPDWSLWRMGRLDDLAWIYAVENATGQDVDETNPPRDAGFPRPPRCMHRRDLPVRDVLIEHTNASLGGTSPYPQ
jgi:hypothetical protein